MNISFDNIGQVCASFACDDTVQVGDACNMSENNTIKRSGEDQPFLGKVLSIRDGIANVAIRGFATFSFTGSAPSVGYAGFCGDGNGNVVLSNEMEPRLVVCVDNIHKTVTVLL